MEKLEQMDVNCLSAIGYAKFEVCVEKTEIKKEKLVNINDHEKLVNINDHEKLVNINDHEKLVKSRLLKLFKKPKLNAKYIEQLIPIERLEYKRVYRNYGIY